MKIEIDFDKLIEIKDLYFKTNISNENKIGYLECLSHIFKLNRK